MPVGARSNSAATSVCSARSFTGTGVDGGVKIGYAGFEGVLYGYSGSGIGTTALHVLPTDELGNTLDSDGGYVQATYTNSKIKLGVSYGISELK
jgi:hypothetical protein